MAGTVLQSQSYLYLVPSAHTVSPSSTPAFGYTTHYMGFLCYSLPKSC